MKEQQARELLKRYRQELCSDEEKKVVEAWLEQELGEGSWDRSQDEKLRFGEMLKSRIDEERADSYQQFPWLRIAVAASIMICLGIGFYFYANRYKQSPDRYLAQHGVVPGGNKATLILANGRSINLSDASSGAIAEQAGITITKTADGQLVYTLADVKTAKPGIKGYNTIATPRGGQYQVRLPDGSKVWLNAASSLKYLASFSAWSERRVELSGEAYFEVAKDKNHPFIVQTRGQEIQVLGTDFNVNSYADEPAIRTTLLQGSVRVSLLPGSKSLPQKETRVILKPGQQSVLSNNTLQVFPQDTEDVIAWKNGYFMFNNESLESIMRKIARWYNVDIEFTDDAIRNHTFYGTMSRYSKVSEVLKKLELTREVKFALKDNKIIIQKN